MQYAKETYSSPILGKDENYFIQEVTGTFLYYAQKVDCTMIAAPGYIATQQANPKKTTKDIKQFLDYATTHPDEIVTYQASDMILSVHSNASYLSETNPMSISGRHFFMSSNSPEPPNNGAVLTIAQITKTVMSSAS